jgi:hypothetical protein
MSEKPKNPAEDFKSPTGDVQYIQGEPDIFYILKQREPLPTCYLPCLLKDWI